jgi:hypothetical protein
MLDPNPLPGRPQLFFGRFPHLLDLDIELGGGARSRVVEIGYDHILANLLDHELHQALLAHLPVHLSLRQAGV